MSLSYKQAVAQRFSVAAPRYDLVAHLQRTVCDSLIQRLPAALQPRDCVDLGAGTGYGCQVLQQRFAFDSLVAVDIAHGMLQHLAQQTKTIDLLCADMEQLPLASQSVDLVFSSLAVQWSLNFEKTLAECKRILRPGGVFAFSSVLEGSLIEFKTSWAQVDQHPHINPFRSQTEYYTLCAQSGFELLSLESQTLRYFYPELKQLRHELRDLGANHVQAGRSPHLATRHQLKTVQQTYEHYRTPAGLPATWRIVYTLLKKPL